MITALQPIIASQKLPTGVKVDILRSAHMDAYEIRMADYTDPNKIFTITTSIDARLFKNITDMDTVNIIQNCIQDMLKQLGHEKKNYTPAQAEIAKLIGIKNA